MTTFSCKMTTERWCWDHGKVMLGPRKSDVGTTGIDGPRVLMDHGFDGPLHPLMDHCTRWWNPSMNHCTRRWTTAPLHPSMHHCTRPCYMLHPSMLHATPVHATPWSTRPCITVVHRGPTVVNPWSNSGGKTRKCVCMSVGTHTGTPTVPVPWVTAPCYHSCSRYRAWKWSPRLDCELRNNLPIHASRDTWFRGKFTLLWTRD